MVPSEPNGSWTLISSPCFRVIAVSSADTWGQAQEVIYCFTLRVFVWLKRIFNLYTVRKSQLSVGKTYMEQPSTLNSHHPRTCKLHPEGSRPWNPAPSCCDVMGQTTAPPWCCWLDVWLEVSVCIFISKKLFWVMFHSHLVGDVSQVLAAVKTLTKGAAVDNVVILNKESWELNKNTSRAMTLGICFDFEWKLLSVQEGNAAIIGH